MKQISNYNDLAENEVVSNNLPKGLYVLRVMNVEDVPEKEYLKVFVEIIDGEYKGYFLKQKEQFGEFPNQGIWYASYKETAGKFFKAFITAIQKSNNGYVWNWDEKTLINKICVGVFGEEEYQANDGSIKVSVKMREIRSTDALKKGEIKVPDLKKLSKKVEQVQNVNPISDNEMPF